MPKERRNDEMLVRIDERLESLNREITENVRPDISNIEKYNKAQNDKIIKVIEKSASNETRGKTNTRLIVFAISLSTGVGIYAISQLRGAW